MNQPILTLVVRHALQQPAALPRPAHVVPCMPPPPLVSLPRSRLASRSALASVMDSAGRALPHKSRQALLRRYKQSAMQLRRRERRSGGGEGWDSEEGSEAPAAFDALPADVIALVFMWGWAAVAPLFMWGEFVSGTIGSYDALACQVMGSCAGTAGGHARQGEGMPVGALRARLPPPQFSVFGPKTKNGGTPCGGRHRSAWLLLHQLLSIFTQNTVCASCPCRHLDPLTLGRAACVNREWRAAAADEALWVRHCTALLGCGTARRSQPQRAHSSHRQCFAATAAQHPELLLPWRTNRVLLGGRPAWLPPGQRPPVRCRHVGPAAVLAWCHSGGRRAGSCSSGSDSSGGDGGGKDELGQRLRFWQLT